MPACTYTDTHCHLDAAEFDADRDAVHQRAVAAGVGRIIVPAVERANFGAVAATCREFPGCAPAYGIHPLFVARARDEDIDALRETLQREAAQVVAVGEIGLDYFVRPHDPVDAALQKRWFTAQLQLAREFDLPVLLHVRRAVDEVLQHLRRHPVRGGIAHAFNGSREQATAFIKLGFKLGFGGAMTFMRARHLRELAATLPLASLVLETDAPDMAPAWAGRRNEPGELPLIAATLAELRGVSIDEIAAATQANVAAVLPQKS